jgi:drug/metabolite transporter (DMT)-like permease
LEIGIILLVLAAAFLHAAWNALVKTSSDRLLVLSSVALAQSAAGTLAIFFFPAPDLASWPSIAISTLFHYMYYTFLYQAYRFGDLSQVYPIARGLAPVLVAIGGVIFGGEMLSTQPLLGVLITSLGISSLALFQNQAIKQNPQGLFWVLGTGAIIAGYTVADGVGVRASGSPFGYIAWLFFFEFPIVIFAFYRRRGRLVASWAATWKHSLGTGLSSLFAYAFVIYAVMFAPMAAVSALRETSVIMAALIGTFILGERPWQHRVIAATIVAGGVALITTAG